jgi:iron complex transport system permease protein
MGSGSGRIFRRGAALWILALVVAVLAALTGRYPSAGILPPGVLTRDELARTILFTVRIPRVLAAALLGAVLAASGNAFQMIFSNPLVEPGFLGVSQGAAFGAALALILGARNDITVAAGAFFFALAGLGASAALARKFRFGGWVLRLVLAGIAVGAFFSSALTYIKYAADPLRELPDITYWTMGGLSGISWKRLAAVSPVALGTLVVLRAAGWRLSLLSLEDTVSFSLGARPSRERGFFLTIAVAGVAAMTAVSGVVAWVGLIVPHAARLLAGSDGRKSMPASMALGAAFVLICDTLARTLLPGELPLGAATAFLGTAAFTALLLTRAVTVVR